MGSMYYSIITLLVVICLGLFAWIIIDIRKSRNLKVENILAIVGLIVTILVAVAPTLEGQNPLTARATVQPLATAQVTPRVQTTLPDEPMAPLPTATRAADLPNVRIVGPLTAPLKEITYFTFVSENAARLEWSIGGFTENIQVVEPVATSHQIFVEPKNPSTAGEVFIIRVTVYSKTNASATAEHQFTVVEE